MYHKRSKVAMEGLGCMT